MKELLIFGSWRFGGLGIGLTIAREIVELHDRPIEVTSDGLNQGATLMINLPVHNYVRREDDARSVDDLSRWELTQNSNVKE